MECQLLPVEADPSLTTTTSGTVTDPPNGTQ